MTILKTKATSAGRRSLIKVINENLFTGGPYLNLVKSLSRTGGRNNLGRITMRHRGGGHRKIYRVIDFKRDKDNVIGTVERVEYDPNRSSFIALILYADGERRYIISEKNLKVGDKVLSGDSVAISFGNCLPLKNIPVGSVVHCVELQPGKGAQIARSAGSYANILAKEGRNVTLKLKSGEIRIVAVDCRATIGIVSNVHHNLRSFGKAGAVRWLGIRPHVRGVAMNPIDHPHGGGEGRTSGGRHPVSPWGVPTKGYKTRNNKRTDKSIVRRREINR